MIFGRRLIRHGQNSKPKSKQHLQPFPALLQRVGFAKIQNVILLFIQFRRYMAEILPVRRKKLFNQSTIFVQLMPNFL